MATSESSSTLTYDCRHKLPEEPLARESLVFMLQLPEHQIAAFVYTWVNGLGRAGSAMVVYGPKMGEPYADKVDGIEVPATMGFEDWRVGGVRVRHESALHTASVEYEGPRCRLRYHFSAVHPPYAYSSHADGCPSWVADDRVEQSGRVQGELVVDGARIEFDTMGHRDHSWGTRDWSLSQHWKWCEAQAGPDVAVHFWDLWAVGRRALRGYVFREGELSPVTGVEVAAEHDEHLMPSSVRADVIDALGRRTHLQGTVFASYPFGPFGEKPAMLLNEASMEVTIDGRPGVGHIEACWPLDYANHAAEAGAHSRSALLGGLPRHGA